jgi:hypothetical protein
MVASFVHFCKIFLLYHVYDVCMIIECVVYIIYYYYIFFRSIWFLRFMMPFNYIVCAFPCIIYYTHLNSLCCVVMRCVHVDIHVDSVIFQLWIFMLWIFMVVCWTPSSAPQRAIVWLWRLTHFMGSYLRLRLRLRCVCVSTTAVQSFPLQRLWCVPSSDDCTESGRRA